MKILQVNFKTKRTKPELEQAFMQAAQLVANFKGLLWKVWIVNEAEKSAGGIYLFEDDASVEAYLKGKIVSRVKSSPATSDYEAKVFDVVPEPTKVTRGPLG